jgi:hypothetical protein
MGVYLHGRHRSTFVFSRGRHGDRQSRTLGACRDRFRGSGIPQGRMGGGAVCVNVAPVAVGVMMKLVNRGRKKMPRRNPQEPAGRLRNRRHEKTVGSYPQNVKSGLPATAEEEECGDDDEHGCPGGGLGDCGGRCAEDVDGDIPPGERGVREAGLLADPVECQAAVEGSRCARVERDGERAVVGWCQGSDGHRQRSQVRADLRSAAERGVGTSQAILKQADLLVGEPDRGRRLHCHLPSFAGFVVGEASAFAGNVERRWCSRARFSIPKVKYARARARCAGALSSR